MVNCGCDTKPINMCIPNKPSNDSYNYNNLRNKPQINGTALMGDLTSVDLGLYGEGNTETAIYKQTVASDLWHIEHKLKKFPSVTVVDSAGTVVTGEVTYLDEGTLEVAFSGAFSGTVYLN